MFRDGKKAGLAIALVLVLVAFAFWQSRGALPDPQLIADGAKAPPPRAGADAQRGDGSTDDGLASAPTAAPSSLPSPAPGESPPATVAADDPIGGLPQVVALAKQAAGTYRDLAQYPPWSRPFNEEGEDPILRDRLVSPITGAGPEGREPILVVFPDQVSFEVPDPVLLYAYLTVDESRVPASSISGAITAENLQPLVPLTYVDDGTGGDRVSGDLLYTARFEPGPDFAPDLSESFLVQVVATTDAGEERQAATSFLYSRPHARLTGAYRDSIVDGSLAIDAEVEVGRAGRFHLEGTLYSQDGTRAIGEAQTAGELSTGRHWMRLTFFGRIINQSAVDGPYLLRFVALSTTTAMPNAKNRLVTNAHVTGSYRFAQFDPAPFGDADLLDAADRLEADVR
jgi:hypothetical protein